MSGKINPIYLGLETGGSKIVATLADEQAQVLLSQSAPRHPRNRAPETLRALIELAQSVLTDPACGARTLAAVGFGFGGPVNRDRNAPSMCHHEEGWEDFDSVPQLEQALGAPVLCENDCNAAALAEAHRGAGSADGVTFYFTVGSGIGGGIVHNGRILECSPWGEAEVGHIVLEEDGPLCPCGNRGCLEALCSGWGLAEMGRNAASDFSGTSQLAARVGEMPTGEVARALFAAYPDDPLAAHCIQRFCDYMARASALVINLLAPKVIVFGGGVMHNAWLPGEIQERTRSLVAPHLRQPCQFEPARLGDQAVSLGAILYAMQVVRDREGSEQNSDGPGS